jgi:serine protease Do
VQGAFAGEGVLEGLDRDLRELAGKAGPAVVRVTSERKLELEKLKFGGIPDGLLPPEGFPGIEAKVVSIGSGFLVSKDGLIATAHQVVEGTETARVELPDGRNLDAEVVGSDDFFHVALLRAKGLEGAEPLVLADDGPPPFGALGVVLGNSLGEARSVCLAIVTGCGRTFESHGFDNYLTLNAEVRPGDVGGPLLDPKGRVIGMAVSGPLRARGQIGFSFGAGPIRGFPGTFGPACAIPARDVRYAIDEIEAYGRVRHGRLGVLLKPTSVEVREVVPDMPAEGAGILPGDRILAVGDERVDDEDRLRFVLRRMPVGVEIRVRVTREGAELSSVARLEEHVAMFDGVLVRIRDDGFVVTGVSPRWSKAGLVVGDAIVAVNGMEVAAAESHRRILHAESPVRLTVRRGDETLEIAVDR